MEFEEFKQNIVSFEAFNSYFDTAVLRFQEQTEALIIELYQPFDKELHELTQLNLEDFLNFYHFVEKEMIKKLHEKYDFLSIEIENIKNQFGQKKTDLFLTYFSLPREKRNFGYYNSDNPFFEKPLCLLPDKKRLFIFQLDSLIDAIYSFLLNIIENPQNNFHDRYIETRARTIERLFLDQFKKYFKDSAKYHKNVCEEKGNKEHDLLIEYNKYILIIEIKSSKIREPFFNPKKSYIRLKDNFDSDSGIGGGYEQAIRLKKIIENKKEVTLYEEKTKPFNLYVKSKKILLIVLTLNRYGGIAVNMSSLLKKENDQPYPWACNLEDLEYIIKVNDYLKKKPIDLIRYIEWRIQEHERLLASDELDIFEEYCMNPKIRAHEKEKRFFLTIIPNIVDKVRYEYLKIPYYYPPLDDPKRNGQCPCGSGKKFKNCCQTKYEKLKSQRFFQ